MGEQDENGANMTENQLGNDYTTALDDLISKLASSETNTNTIFWLRGLFKTAVTVGQKQAAIEKMRWPTPLGGFSKDLRYSGEIDSDIFKITAQVLEEPTTNWSTADALNMERAIQLLLLRTFQGEECRHAASRLVQFANTGDVNERILNAHNDRALALHGGDYIFNPGVKQLQTKEEYFTDQFLKSIAPKRSTPGVG